MINQMSSPLSPPTSFPWHPQAFPHHWSFKMQPQHRITHHESLPGGWFFKTSDASTVRSLVTGAAAISCHPRSSSDWPGWGLMSCSICPRRRDRALSAVPSLLFRRWTTGTWTDRQAPLAIYFVRFPTRLGPMRTGLNCPSTDESSKELPRHRSKETHKTSERVSEDSNESDSAD